MASENTTAERQEPKAEPEVVADSLVQFVDGFPLPTFEFTPERFREALSLNVMPGDIILSTYPKCGTTWMQYIIWGLKNKGVKPPSMNQMMFKEFPFIEVMGGEPFQELKEPRLAKFHLPYDMTPKCPGAKLVHVLRNPFDACVSLYSHIVEIDAITAGIEYPFDPYFETFLQGRSMFGDYFEHEISWFEQRNNPDVLLMTFESLKRDPRSAILKIADFLGYGQQVRQDKELLENVLKYTSFDFMKGNCLFRLARTAETMAIMGEEYFSMCLDDEKVKDETLFRTVNFFRKGQVGSSKERLSTDQWRRIEEAIQKRVTEPALRKLMTETGRK